MKQRIALAGVPLALVMAAACSSAPHSVKTERVSEAWSGQPYKNLLVVGVYDDRTYRTSAETAFAEKLKSQGIAADPSFDVIVDLKSLDSEEDIETLLAGRKNDAVLTVATLDAGYDFDYDDAMANRGMVYLLGGRPGVGTALGNFIAWAGSGFYSLHIGLWDAKSQEPVWQVTTNSASTGSEFEDLHALVDFVVATLREKGML